MTQANPTLNTNDPRARKKSRRTMLLLFGLFATPFVAAWVMATFYPDVIRNMGTTNYGQFIDPVRELPTQPFVTPAGETVDNAFMGKWSMVYIDGAACDDVCQANLGKARNIRLTQGGEMNRIQRVWLVSDQQAINPELKDFIQEKDLKVLRAEAHSMQAFLTHFRLNEQDDVLAAHRIYIVDPLGRLMMYHDLNQESEQMEDSNGLRKDLKKLLKNSRIG